VTDSTERAREIEVSEACLLEITYKNSLARVRLYQQIGYVVDYCTFSNTDVLVSVGVALIVTVSFVPLRA
jgi:hypothetical protein